MRQANKKHFICYFFEDHGNRERALNLVIALLTVVLPLYLKGWYCAAPAAGTAIPLRQTHVIAKEGSSSSDDDGKKNLCVITLCFSPKLSDSVSQNDSRITHTYFLSGVVQGKSKLFVRVATQLDNVCRTTRGRRMITSTTIESKGETHG